MAKEQNKRAEVESGKIDDIRNILFGNNIAEYNKRFSVIEQKLIDEISVAKEDNRKQVETLEKYSKNEIGSLISDLNKEKEERMAAIQKLGEEIKEFKKSFSEFEKATNKNLREIRTLILEQSSELDGKINKEVQNLRKLIISNFEELDSSKVSRSSLAVLFSDMALELGGQPDQANTES